MDNEIYDICDLSIVCNNIQTIDKLRNNLKILNFYNFIEFQNKIKKIKIIRDCRDKNDNDFYYKTLSIDNLNFFYINFNNGTDTTDHFLNINNYKIFCPDKNSKLVEKYKNNISFIFEEMNFITITEEMFIEFIKIIFEFLKI